MKHIIRLVLLSILCLPISTLAMQGHKHKMAEIITVACADKQAAPSLKCGHTPSAVFDHKGRLWLAWADANHVYVNYSDDKGKTYSTPMRVNAQAEPIAARGENRPKIVIAKNAQVYVSWTMKLPKRFSGHVRFSRSLDGGKTFSVPITVNDHLEVTSHRFESMAVNDKGEIFIAWLDKRDLMASKAKGEEYTGAAVYYAVSTDEGRNFQANQKIADHSCECCRTVMAIDTDGLPVILWRHIFGKNTRDHALVKLTASNKVGEVRRASFDNWQVDGCPHHGPALSVNHAGIYHLAWFNNAPERHGLFYTNSYDVGKSYATPIAFGDYAKGAAHPQVLSVGDKVFLLWQEFDGKQHALRLMHSLYNGRDWSDVETLMQSDIAVDYPLLLSDGDDVYAAWHRRGEDYRLIKVDD